MIASAVAFLGAACSTASAAFTTEGPFAALDAPYGQVATDFTGDGTPDLATINGTSSAVMLSQRNIANGQWTTIAFGWSVGSGPNHGTAADFNGDNRPDLAVSSYNSSAGTNDVTILRRDATVCATQLCFATDQGPAASFATAITSADFDGDGKIDLAVSRESGTNGVSILRNTTATSGNVPTTFSLVDTVATGAFARYVAKGDFNGDNIPDLAVANSSAGTVSILIRKTDRTGFLPKADITGVGSPQTLAVADFNNDGKSDVAVPNYNGGGAGTVRVYLRNAANTGFDPEGAALAVGNGPIGVIAPDFNGDGAPDLAVANAAADSITVLLRKATNDGFVLDGTTALGGAGVDSPNGLAAADFNGDARADFAYSADQSDQWGVFINAFGPSNLTRPKIGGVPAVGRTLTCTAGTWGGSPTVQTFWDRAPRGVTTDADPSWAAIDGATGSTYVVRDADVGSRVRCRETATNANGSGQSPSTSLRTDVNRPNSLTPPTVLGAPVSGQTLTCEPGTWDSGPDFTYQWERDGVLIAGATGSTYVPTQGRTLDLDIGGDGGHRITCLVTGTNDVGVTGPVRSHNTLQIVDGVPLNVRRPTAAIDLTRPNAIGRVVSCTEGIWLDDYGTRGTAEFHYEYQWYRDNQAIAGAVTVPYRTTADDLGHSLSCGVTSSNPLGRGREARSSSVLAPLPPGTAGGRMYTAGGENEFDPVNLLALSGEYLAAVQAITADRLRDAVTDETRGCRSRSGVPGTAPDPSSVKLPIDAVTRCRILLHAPTLVTVGKSWPGSPGVGVQYRKGTCGLSLRTRCPDLGFVVAPIDPTKAPGIDPALQARLESVTPDRVLWDLDGDGRTDASCPGTAPVLRTMLDRGGWRPRAVLVARDSADTGVFGEAVTAFNHPNDNFTSKAGVRPAQPFVCRTSLEPPPKADVGPCVTNGNVGRVRITGNLCPVSVRSLDQKEIDNLRTKDPELYQVLTKMAAALALHRAKDDRVFVRPEPLAAARAFANVSANDRLVAATYLNTSSSLTAFNNGTDRLAAKVLSPTLLSRFANIAKLDEKKVNFALDQIYIARDALKANGVTIDPLGDSIALLIPSDVREAIQPVKEMTLSARNASRSLGNLPMAAQEQLQAQFKDVASQAEAALPKVNLDQLKADLAKKLDLGPFKLSGAADIKLENDGTATLKAQADLPGLKTGPGGKPISVGITLRGDLNGNVKLEGVRLQAPKAYIGGVLLQDMDLRFENGLDVKGKLLFPPVNAGISVNRFRLGPKGQFQELDVDYLAGSGQGIPIGSGVFITKLGGGLSLDPDEIRARATISVGPSTGGGCPTVGVEAGFVVHFSPPPFAVDATGNVQVACISLLNIKFHADSTGYVSLAGTYDYTLGPIFARGGMGAAFKLPDWQAQVRGEIGVKLPLVGRVSEGGELVLSNRGLAGCIKVDLGFLGSVAGGASVKFSNGRPPFNILELISNIRLFTGCDLSAFKPLGNVARAAQAPAGSKTFTIPKGKRGIALSIEGAGDAPRVKLRSPSGKVLDYSQGEGAKLPEGIGFVIEEEDRTVVLMGKPEAGRWTAETTPGSPAVARIQLADILPAAAVRGKVSGIGASRVLSYDVTPRTGQVVRLLEQAPGAVKLLKTITGGGKGTVRFTTSEATGTKRRVVAEITQDGVPRETIDVASFTAPSPRVSRPKVKVKRRGRGALITWSSASFATRYEVTVTAGDGRELLLTPSGKRREVTVRSVAKGEGLQIAVVGISQGSRRGPAGRAKLPGSMRIGAAKKPKKSKS